jgi:hypothetical protein
MARTRGAAQAFLRVAVSFGSSDSLAASSQGSPMESATEFPNEMALWMSCGSCVRIDFGFVKHCGAHWPDRLGNAQNIRQRPLSHAVCVLSKVWHAPLSRALMLGRYEILCSVDQSLTDNSIAHGRLSRETLRTNFPFLSVAVPTALSLSLMSRLMKYPALRAATAVALFLGATAAYAQQKTDDDNGSAAPQRQHSDQSAPKGQAQPQQERADPKNQASKGTARIEPNDKVPKDSAQTEPKGKVTKETG